MASFTSESPFRFRITGKQSIERLEPLTRQLFPFAEWCDEGDKPLDFVWETTCEKSHRDAHAQAIVLSRLHNTQVIESKANLAFLQETMDVATVESYVITNYSKLLPWLEKRYEGNDENEYSVWWVLKASHGNGGKDIWLINRTNYKEIIAELSVQQEYVLQR